MAGLKNLRVQQFRIHQNYELSLSERVTVISGPNGSGKTSLLEAIYIGLTGSSFKSSDQDIIQNGQDWYRLDLAMNDWTERVVKYDGRKQFVVNGKKSFRLGRGQKYPVVLFEPDDLRLLHGSPSRRRQFIDRFIAQLDPSYSQVLRRYDRSLKQRNTLLKQPTINQDDLFAWDVSLARLGATIIKNRQDLVVKLNSKLQSVYQKVAQTNDKVELGYPKHPSGNLEQNLLHQLEKNIQRDKTLGFTSTGPHRHDVEFRFNGRPAIGVASRGEVRSLVLALKFLEVQLIQQVTSLPVIILLDDVFSELDSQRQHQLQTAFSDNQIIITAATRQPIDVGSVKYVELD